MSAVGFGSYRVSIKSSEHYNALKKAIELGCPLIDTSSNYTDGDSELLIGKVLKETGSSPLIISKVGYIQGKTLANLDDSLKAELVEINEGLNHSIHPSFIENQLNQSLERLGVECLDAYLLHNPEYYLKTEGSNKKEYYRRIKEAFYFLETKVKEGKIKSYGISSNTFVDPKDDHESTSLEEVLKISKKIENNHFKYIQFPLNLLELGALERQFDGDHLIEFAKKNNLKTIVNRPLNAFSSQGLIRLANYNYDESYNDSFEEKIFVDKVESLVKKWEEDKEEGDEGLFEIPLFNQISNIWYKQNSIDAVDQIFYAHFFPFIASVWGENLSAKESQPFYDLYEIACEFVRKNMNTRANAFKETAINQGLLFESDKPLSQMAIEKYFSFGVDFILVGMKKEKYVLDMKDYFIS